MPGPGRFAVAGALSEGRDDRSLRRGWQGDARRVAIVVALAGPEHLDVFARQLAGLRVGVFAHPYPHEKRHVCPLFGDDAFQFALEQLVVQPRVDRSAEAVLFEQLRNSWTAYALCSK